MYTYTVTETRTHHIQLPTPDPDQARQIVDEAIPEFPGTVFDVEWGVEAPTLLALASEALLDHEGIEAHAHSSSTTRGVPQHLIAVTPSAGGDLCIQITDRASGLMGPADGPSALQVRILRRDTLPVEEVNSYAAPLSGGYEHALESLQAITDLVRRHTI